VNWIRLGSTLVTLCAALVLGCGDDAGGDGELRCDQETRADQYAPGMIATGDDGVFRIVLVESLPGPPEKGDNQFTLEVLEAASDTAVPSATLSVTPFMPDHNHGTPITPIVSDGASPGEFQVDRINLWMPGLWEVQIGVSAGPSEDRVVFAFCIEG
jgi:hypothetical protein